MKNILLWIVLAIFSQNLAALDIGKVKEVRGLAEDCLEIQKDIKKLISKGITSNFTHWGIEGVLKNIFKKDQDWQEWKQNWALKRRALKIDKEALARKIQEFEDYNPYKNFDESIDPNYYWQDNYDRLKEKSKKCIKHGKDILTRFRKYLIFANDEMISHLNEDKYQAYKAKIDRKFFDLDESLSNVWGKWDIKAYKLP